MSLRRRAIAWCCWLVLGGVGCDPGGDAKVEEPDVPAPSGEGVVGADADGKDGPSPPAASGPEDPDEPGGRPSSPSQSRSRSPSPATPARAPTPTTPRWGS